MSMNDLSPDELRGRSLLNVGSVLILLAIACWSAGCKPATPKQFSTPTVSVTEERLSIVPISTVCFSEIVPQVTLGYGPLWTVTPSPIADVIAAATTAAVVVHEADTLESRWFRLFDEGRIGAISWNQDGTQLRVARIMSNPDSIAIDTLDATNGEKLSSVSLGGNEASLSPDGALVLVSSATPNGNLSVWDANTGQQIGALDLKIQSGRMTLIAWSPDGKQIAYGGTGGDISIWDVRAGQRQSTVRDGLQPVIGRLAFSPDGQRLMISSSDNREGGTLSEVTSVSGVWDLNTRRWLWQRPIQLEGYVWSQDGQMILAQQGFAAMPNTLIVRLNAQSGTTLNTFSGMAGTFAVGLGNALFQFSTDYLWRLDPETLSPQAKAAGYISLLWDIGANYAAFSPDGALVATASKSGVIFWDVYTGQERLRIEGERGPLAWSPNGSRLAVRNWESGIVTLWDPANGQKLVEVPSGLTHMGLLGWVGPDRLFTSGNIQQDVTLQTETSLNHGAWGIALLDVQTRMIVYAQAVTGISETAFAANQGGDQYAYSVYGPDSGGIVVIANGRTGEPLADIATEVNHAGWLAWSPDSAYLAGVVTPELLTWSSQTYQIVLRKGSSGLGMIDAAGLGWLSNDQIAVVGSTGDRLDIWSVKEEARLAQQPLNAEEEARFVRAMDVQQGLFLFEDLSGLLHLWSAK